MNIIDENLVPNGVADFRSTTSCTTNLHQSK